MSPNARKYMFSQASLQSKAHLIQNYTAVPKKEYPEHNELFLFLYASREIFAYGELAFLFAYLRGLTWKCFT